MRNLESSNTLNTHEGVDDSSSSAVSGPALQRPIPQREAQGLSAMVRWPLVLGGSDMVVPSLVTDQNRMQLMQSSSAARRLELETASRCSTLWSMSSARREAHSDDTGGLFKKIFKAWDKNNDGILSVKEFMDGLKQIPGINDLRVEGICFFYFVFKCIN